jgi:hypothetical protein
MAMKFKTVIITTIKGVKEAEQLKADGWKIEATSFSTIQFSNGKSNKH